MGLQTLKKTDGMTEAGRQRRWTEDVFTCYRVFEFVNVKLGPVHSRENHEANSSVLPVFPRTGTEC